MKEIVGMSEEALVVGRAEKATDKGNVLLLIFWLVVFVAIRLPVGMIGARRTYFSIVLIIIIAIVKKETVTKQILIHKVPYESN